MSTPLNLLSVEDNLVLERLRTEGKAWIVGGWVRDSLLGKINPDLDIATTLTPDKVKDLFPRTIPIGEDYGTVIVRLEGNSKNEWEVTTLRKEGTYGDGRRPDNVTFGKEIEADLARRDFTINAMAIDDEGRIIDLFGGKNDLQNNTLRAVGEARERIAEDGLRIMRAFRFLDKDENSIRTMEEDLENAICENKEMLKNVSNERIGEEIKRILSSKCSDKILTKMKETGVLSVIFNDMLVDLTDVNCTSPLVILAKILRNNESEKEDIYVKLRDKLKYSKRELELISFLHAHRNVEFKTNIESLRRFNNYLSDEQKSAILEYHQPLEFIQQLEKLIKPHEKNSPLVDGITLSEVTGIKPGRKLGMLKGWLFRQQIEKNITCKDDVLKNLEHIDWKNDNYDKWPVLSWP
ncbi:TPA: CCA tRNA nucleotidyltransferase [Candidatus Thalassarchaeaceae archaeon]|jgi:tRNA nucleotidyltransferase (CCA-adding enzyme)|nr:CCA tRNA nucleotidyltransferase [Euryarchaeota archaeon]MDG1548115.1 CCA tRNA nucleotidyltransferase [Candidatus Thalassarchaeaceae archaeon]DAC61324.1 MAG TPA: CCA tRNA nucleotidyltransferase [Candidatus Poseidoniales archaeon]MDC0501657.1 CCA tRNA nucleotidyltransferase [Euryarchaeota archaeon]DAC66724.1 MAG TPA: CCA tRNA nucleotidyltransferase [Candidatus Poseidoniales archaeon]|tara:strand:+ start:2593 stop:3816 length:1224 start_codon:yes stop_codon:yes gene_type:complete